MEITAILLPVHTNWSIVRIWPLSHRVHANNSALCKVWWTLDRAIRV